MANSLEKSIKPEYWHDLTEAEKRAIRDPKDEPIISVIKAIPQDVLKKLDMLLEFLPADEFFIPEELPWVKDFLWYKNEKGCEEGVSWDRMCAEYRLYFAARHPDRIKGPHVYKIKSFIKWITFEKPKIKKFLKYIALGKEYYQAQAA
jgi:hypothetical protein